MRLLLLCLVFAGPVWAHEGEEEDEVLDAGVTTPQTVVRSNRPVHAASETVVARDPGYPAWAAPLATFLEQGCLARRITRALGHEVTPERLRQVYGQLSDCLRHGALFVSAAA